MDKYNLHSKNALAIMDITKKHDVDSDLDFLHNEWLVSCQNCGQSKTSLRTWVSVQEVQDVNEWYITAGWLTDMELVPHSHFEV